MTTSHEDWLALEPEEALDPGLRICDPHHHLWDHPGSRYLLEELLEDTGSGHHIVSTVFVECTSKYRPDGPVAKQPLGETEFVESVARAATEAGAPTAVAAGIVGFADLTLGDGVAPVLEEHLELSSSRFRGIRHAAGWDSSDDVRNSHTDPPRGLLLDADFRRGFACLERYGLSFDGWQYHSQIGELTDLARCFPGVAIVLDHVGGPLGIGPWAGRRAEIFESWRKTMSELSQCSNVVVKLGGLGMPICGFDFHKQERPPSSEACAQAWKPYLLHCIESFGPSRCMFESNFPVDKRSCSYTVLWNAFKRVAEGFSDSEKADLFCDTAVRTYRL